MSQNVYQKRLKRSRRDEVLEVIIKMIEAGDMQAFTLRGVAKSIGMDPTTLNHHFGGWTSLANLILSELLALRLSRYQRALAGMKSVEQIREILLAISKPKPTTKQLNVYQWVLGVGMANADDFAVPLHLYMGRLADAWNGALININVSQEYSRRWAEGLALLDSGIQVQLRFGVDLGVAVDTLVDALLASQKAAEAAANDSGQLRLDW